jgi:hypothetical protein
MLPLPEGEDKMVVAVGIGFRWIGNRNRLRQEVLDIDRVLK